MLVNVYHDSPREHRRLLVAGVAFLTVIALLIGLSIAVYNKTFDRVTTVTIQADRAGLQLAKFGDVRVNGALVGQVRKVDQKGDQALITVALDPLSRILNQLFPLLRSIRPADLNATLNALSTALAGRGEQLGRTMDQLDDYLGRIDDHLPTLRTDLVKLADVARTYDVAAPDLLATLRNVTVTGQTIVDDKQQLSTFFSDLGGLADTSTRVLSQNSANLIRVGQVTEPVLRLLAVYSPELPCLIKGAARYAPRLARTFEGNQVKQYVEFGTPQYNAYDRSDQPTYGEVGHGPWCLGLPNPPVPAPPIALKQGSDIDEHPPTSVVPDYLGLNRPGVDYSGSEGEQRIVNALLAERTGADADSFGSLGALMFGPLLREGVDAR